MADKKMVEKNQKNEAEKAADVTANDTNKKAAPVKAEESGKANTKGVDVEQKEIIKGIEAVGSVAAEQALLMLQLVQLILVVKLPVRPLKY